MINAITERASAFAFGIFLAFAGLIAPKSTMKLARESLNKVNA